MAATDCEMCATDGLLGKGIYNENNSYVVHNATEHYITIRDIFRSKGSNALENGFPTIWDKSFLSIHNCVVASSAIVKKSILENYNCLQFEPNGSGDDYRIWLRVLEHTNCVYIKDICFYYDNGHGNSE